MKEFKCKWLPDIFTLEESNRNWETFNKRLYEQFINDFIDSSPIFEKKPVSVRINPRQDDYEHAFIHLTCTSTKMSDNPNDRIPDLRRCERISWNRKIIENFPCIENCSNCKKILYYEHYFRNKIRINLVLVDARFKVILERRDKYILLITGYYIEFDSTIDKEIKRANIYSQQKTPLE